MEIYELHQKVNNCIEMLSRNVNDSFGTSIIEDVCEPIGTILSALVVAEEAVKKEEEALYRRINEIQAMG